LMIILLAIIIFAIVAVVVRGFVTDKTETIDLNADCLDVDMSVTRMAKWDNSGSVNYDGATTPPTDGYPQDTPEGNQQSVYAITISRNSGGDPIEGFTLFIENGEGTYSQSRVYNLGTVALSKNTINFALRDDDSWQDGEIALFPYFIKGNGAQYDCPKSSTFEISVDPETVSAGDWNSFEADSPANGLQIDEVPEFFE